MDDRKVTLGVPELPQAAQDLLSKAGNLQQFYFTCGMLAWANSWFPFPEVRFDREEGLLWIDLEDESYEYVDHFGDPVSAPIPRRYEFRANPEGLAVCQTFDLEPLFDGGARKLLSTMVVMRDGSTVESVNYFEKMREINDGQTLRDQLFPGPYFDLSTKCERKGFSEDFNILLNLGQLLPKGWSIGVNVYNQEATFDLMDLNCEPFDVCYDGCDVVGRWIAAINYARLKEGLPSVDWTQILPDWANPWENEEEQGGA